MSYDLNGNMLNDGVNAYTWDARNQLASVNGASNLEYDGVGRRERNNASTSYLYDGVNDVQELSPPGPSVSANSVTGGVDQFFSRTDSTGTYYPLTDALGSVIALTNSSKAIVTSYTFVTQAAAMCMILIGNRETNFPCRSRPVLAHFAQAHYGLVWYPPDDVGNCSKFFQIWKEQQSHRGAGD